MEQVPFKSKVSRIVEEVANKRRRECRLKEELKSQNS